MAATERLLAMISPVPAAVVVDKALSQTFLDCLTNPKFVPTLGTTCSLVASGDLRLIGDPEIQGMLTQWPRTAQVLIEWQEIERNHGEELILGLTLDYLAWPNLLSLVNDSDRTSPLESDYQGLFSSKRFEGLLNNRRYNTRESIGRIEKLEAEPQEFVDRLEIVFPPLRPPDRPFLKTRSIAAARLLDSRIRVSSRDEFSPENAASIDRVLQRQGEWVSSGLT
jgi:hypothetical protein